MALKSQWWKRAEMTGGIFTACINSTDSLIPLLGPSGGPRCLSDSMVHYSRCDKHLWFKSASGMSLHRWHFLQTSEHTELCLLRKGSGVTMWSSAASLRGDHSVSPVVGHYTRGAHSTVIRGIQVKHCDYSSSVTVTQKDAENVKCL